MTRKNDPKLPWILLIIFVVVAAVVELVGILLSSPYVFIVLAVAFGVLAAMIVFGRRAQGSAYRQVEGQPGAAAWVLEGMRGDWRVTSGVAGTAQLDAVHRVLGRPASSWSPRAHPAASAACWPRRRRRSPGWSATPRSTTSPSATTRARSRCASSARTS